MAMTTQTSRRPGHYAPSAEINVTPLVDVMLVLLIIFIVTAPMLAAGLRVDLPQSRAAQPLSAKEPVVVSIARDGRIMLGNEMIARDALASAIRKQSGGEPRMVHLRGDKDVPYGEMVAIIDHLASHGIVKVAFMAAPQSGAPPRTASGP